MDTLTQGTELQKVGKQAEAIPYFQQAIREQPDSYIAWTNLSEAQLETEHFAEALQAADQALARNLQYAPAWIMKACALNNLNRPEEAIAACNKALSYDPNLASAHTYKGRILANQERDQEALAEFDQALMIDSTSADALFYKAASLFVLQHFDEAAVIGNRLIILEPASPAGWRIKALALHLGPRANLEALQAIEKALAIEPNDSASLTVKSGVLDDMGRHGEARAVLKRALALDQDNELAREGLGEMNRVRNRQALHVTGGIIGTIFSVIGEMIKAIFHAV
jgi:protein O-GlcNAc transferase